jgi:hypothetical protein
VKTIEEKIVDKIFEFVNFAISFKIKPDITVDKVGDLSLEDIRNLKEQGIKGVILDVDETIRKDKGKIPKCNQEWLEILKKEMKVIVVSNGMDRKMEQFFESKGINYIGVARKPFKKNFNKACTKLGLRPEEMLIIGDDLFSDIYGGKRNNMKTIMVNRVEEER